MDKLAKSRQLTAKYQQQDWSRVADTYQDAGTQYAFDVLDNKVTTGYALKLAAWRHLCDLDCTLTNSQYSYHYDLDICRKVLRFSGWCPDPSTGVPTQLMPWQKFVLCQLFGWRDSLGDKRFANVLISVARGQGKTYLCAIIACYAFFLETMGKENQDLMVASNITTQAKKLYGYIATMANKLIAQYPAFKTLADQTETAVQFNQIIQKAVNNRLLQMSAESGKFDSYHFLSAVFDEAGETNHQTITDKITSGQINTENSQFIQISTAYPDATVPFHSEELRALKGIEEADASLDHQLALVWEQDSEDEIDQPETWVKSNPLLDLPAMHDRLLAGLEKERDTKRLSGDGYAFANKNLNLWLSTKIDAYVKLDDITATVIPEFDIAGRAVYIGFDASLSSDNTALVFVFPYEENGEPRYYIKQHSFIPWKQLGSIEAKEKSDGLSYRQLAQLGFCTITDDPTGLINLDQVFDWLVGFVEANRLDVKLFGFDAMRTNHFTQTLNDKTDWPISAIRQTALELTPAIKFIGDHFARHDITHTNDLILTRALQNAELSESHAGLAIGKNRQSFKIDVVDALIDAFYQGMYHYDLQRDRDDPLSKYSTEEQDAYFWKEMGF